MRQNFKCHPRLQITHRPIETQQQQAQFQPLSAPVGYQKGCGFVIDAL